MDRRSFLGGLSGLAVLPFVKLGTEDKTVETHIAALKEKPKDIVIDLSETTRVDRFKKSAIAVLLDNQRLHNPKFIPLMRSAFEGLALWRMVSIQPILGPTGLVYYIVPSHLSCRSIDSDVVVANEVIELPLGNKMRDLEEGICPEIEREVIKNIRKHAGIVVEWDFATSIGDTIIEKYELLYREISAYSCNWIVTSPEVAAIFETATAGFKPSPELRKHKAGIQHVGVINSRWRLYKDPLFPRGEMIMGRQGDAYMDTGFVFAPRHLDANEKDPSGLVCTWKLIDPNSFVKFRIKNFI